VSLSEISRSGREVYRWLQISVDIATAMHVRETTKYLINDLSHLRLREGLRHMRCEISMLNELHGEEQRVDRLIPSIGLDEEVGVLQND
jgi:hypothetical protein